MAINQITFFLIPREGNYTLFEGLNLKSFLQDSIPEDEGFYLFEDDLFWENLGYKFSEIKELLVNNFTEEESWSDEVKIFGHNDSNCIKIILDDDVIISVSFRINFVINYSNFLSKVIEFSKAKDFLIVDNRLDILNLDYDIINNNICDSDEYLNYKNFNKEG